MSRTPFCCLSRFVGSLFVARCSLHHRPSIHRMIDRVAIAIAIAVLFAIIGIGYSDTNACSALVRLSHAACCLLPVACCLLPAACLLRVCYCSFDYSNFACRMCCILPNKTVCLVLGLLSLSAQKRTTLLFLFCMSMWCSFLLHGNR